jgi:PAS domain S-box-containing protein
MDTYLPTHELSADAKDALLAETVDLLYQGIVVTDPTLPDNPIVYANEAFLELTGYDRSEVIGFNCRFLQGPGTDQATVKRLRDDLVRGAEFFGEILNYRKDGTPFWNALSIKPLRNASGDIVHFVASQTDVTPLKELQQRAEQQQRLELLGTFAGGIAHDFNNVLLATVGFAELLALKLEDEAVRGYAQQIVAAGATGRRLTQQLLEFSKGGGKASPEPIDVSLVAAETAAMAGRLLPAGVQINLELSDEPAVVNASHSQLEQVLLNLVVNARDAIERIGSITVGVARESGSIVVSVTDTGCGMTEAVRERIFESFFTTKPAGVGTGLGLATVSSVVNELGGAIDVTSTVGEGSTFRVVLPEL